MKKLLKKILDIPVQFFIAIAIGIALIYVASLQGQLTLEIGFLIIAVSVIVASYLYIGIKAVKIVFSIVTILYLTSIYTSVVMSATSFVAQPFLLTIAGITGFLAITYDSKYYTFNLRSRSLWASILIFILFSIKATMLISGFGFWTAEATGLIITIAYSLVWRHWTINSKKTKIVEPSVLNTEDDGMLRKIYINNTLDVREQIWTRGSFYKKENSYPYIYNEVMKAKDDNKILVIVSKLVTSSIYDLGEIKENKSQTIPYLYMEAKNDTNSEEIINRFLNDIKTRV